MRFPYNIYHSGNLERSAYSDAPLNRPSNEEQHRALKISIINALAKLARSLIISGFDPKMVYHVFLKNAATIDERIVGQK